MIDIQKPCEAAADKGQKSTGKATADPADVHAMKNLMHREGSAGELSALFSAQLSRRASGKNDPAPQPESPAREYGTRVEARNGERGRGDTPGNASEDASGQAADLAQEVAEHILVSDPEFLEPGTGTEVRIKIRESILKDAHVHLKRTSAHLAVRLLTTDRDSARTLEAAESALLALLKKNFAERIEIKTIYLSRKEPHERP